MKKYFLFICIHAFACSAFACTTFFINKDGQLIFGRNYDWITGNGAVCTNQRGVTKTSFKTSDGESISWTAIYGSITFNQYGKEFPTGGMNESGLVIELMWLDGTEYPQADKRPAIGVLQWIQYHLDQCSTIEEVIAEDAHVRISSKGTTPLHYLVADAKGNAAVIEFLDSKMVVHKGSDLPFPVLANDRYDLSLQQVKTSLTNRSFTNNSLDRFARACSMVQELNANPAGLAFVDYSFKILETVAQGSHTKWSIVYDLVNKRIYFKSLGYGEIKHFSFNAFDFSCKKQSMVFDINQPLKGDVTKDFLAFSLERNAGLIERSFDQSKSEVHTSEKTIGELKDYPRLLRCKE